MFGTLFSSNKASIARKSNNNIIVQDSVINNPVICAGGSDMIKTLGELGRYDSVQQQVVDVLAAASRTHPLYPVFSAKPSKDLSRLVSTPETEDAFKQYPKRIKGTFLIDYKKYPKMDRSETPWEYAYRTQTTVELETTAYQEYLGDIEDPFPVTEYANGMITVIGAPKFPPAVEATIISGEISIPILLRRKPCMDYGKMIFGTISDDHGFDFSLTAYKDFEKTDFKITKAPGCDLFTQLQREKLIVEMSKTKHLKIMIGSSPLVDAMFKEDELAADMFKVAPYMVRYLESLVVIEKHLSCKFDLTIGDVFDDDYRTALILASSLEGKWHRIKTDFDEKIRCDYDHIPDDFVDDVEPKEEIVIEGKVLSISLQGQRFSADKYIIVYKDARLNNVASVIKNRKKKKKNILMTFRPAHGNDYFYKFCKFEGIHLLDSLNITT